MTHPHVAVLKSVYSALADGDIPALLDLCDEKITFQVPGKSALAGKYDRRSYSALIEKMRELSGGSFQVEAHDIMASERHAVVLASNFVERAGEKIQVRTAHVWRFENGKPVAWYEYPRDLYQYDSAWS